MDARKIKFLVSGLVIAGAMAALFVAGLGSRGAAYYVSVSDFLDGRLHGDNFRINGKVVEESIRREPGGMSLSFSMTDGTSVLPVTYHGVVPDTFIDKADVVVEGEMGPDGTFRAHTLFAKCPSKYESAPTTSNQGGTTRPASPGS